MIVIFLILVLIRFINLTHLPIFIDEQTYLQLGDQATKDIGKSFESLNYMVFPVVPWILGFFQLIFKNFFSPLLIGRSVMVLTDVISAGFIYLIGKKLLDKKYALISALIYLSLPLNFFHSRIVLLEPVTNVFFLAGLFLFINRANRINKFNTKLFGQIIPILCFLSLSYLSKPNGLVSFSALPIYAALSNVKNSRKILKEKFYSIVIAVFILALVLAVTAPFSFLVWKGFSDYRIGNNMGLILFVLKKNLWLTYWWTKNYVTIPVIISVILSFLYVCSSRKWKFAWIFVWLASATLINCLFGVFFLPRHLFLLSPAIALSSALIFWFSFKNSKLIITGLIIFSFVFLVLWKINYKIVFNPKTAPIALEDKQQFFEDWTSGSGLEKVAAKLKELSNSQKILVVTESNGGFGWSLTNLYDIGNSKVIEAELEPNKNMLEVPKNIGDNKPTYIILNKIIDPPPSWPLDLIAVYPKVNERRFIKIYRYR